jgi:predicted CxxxxCH...CXXCH cytochrome family protein
LIDLKEHGLLCWLPPRSLCLRHASQPSLLSGVLGIKEITLRFTMMISCGLLAIGCAQPSQGVPHADANVARDGFPSDCSNCHGSDESPAPPANLLGQSDPAQRGVGAHRAHLLAAHGLSKPVPCASCHLVPAKSDDPGHRDGLWPAEVVFSGLAVAGGAKPVLNADRGTGDARRDARIQVTCASVYCHGAKLSGGTATTPVWNSAAGTDYVGCGSCHGFPPPAPHTQSSACSSCHDTVGADNISIAKPAQHVDGKVNVVGGSGGTSCNGCHGSADNDAPPKDTHGNTATTAIGVGAHQKHLQVKSAKAIGCADCHVVPSSMAHASGAAEVAFGPRSKSGGLSPSWSEATATCASTWCHGPTRGGGSNHSPVWTQVGSGQAACGTCHGVPPPAPHVQSSACSSCHDTVGADNATIAKPEQHVDGTVNVAGGGGGNRCNSCHGGAGSNAPPKDTHGNTATSSIGVGAHQQHLQAAKFSNPIACDQCHSVPSSMSHSNGVVELTWGPLAKANGLSPSFDPSAATCSNVWCHAPVGYGLLLPGTSGGLNSKPIWTGTNQATCGACHGVPPFTGAHFKHAAAGCDSCHSGYSFLSVNKANHVNGKVDIGGSRLSASNYGSGSCAPACHGRESWGGGGD